VFVEALAAALKVPAAQGAQERSAVVEAIAEKYVPAGQLADCSWQAVARAVPIVEGEAAGANVPKAQVVQTRSATAVLEAEKKVPAGHVAEVTEGQPAATAAPAAEFVLEAEKVPAAHGLHVRSPVGIAGAE